jgi:hypothetical protein
MSGGRPKGQQRREKMEQFSVRFDAIEMQKLQMLMNYFGVSRLELVRAYMYNLTNRVNDFVYASADGSRLCRIGVTLRICIA